MSSVNIFEHATKTENGFEVNGIVLEPVVESCEGCERIMEIQGEKYCTSYAKPSAKWRHGACNFATHVKASIDKQGKVKVNPIKASKRAARKR